MLQRIQTLYLFIVVIAMGLMLYFPFLSAITPDGIDYQLAFRGFCPINEPGFNINGATLWLSITTALIPLIALITINLYKFRVLQMRISTFNLILMLGWYAIFFSTRFVVFKQITIDSSSLNWPVVLPAICAILTYLAIRRIGADEALVRSLDRLR